ncbi:hypothetical protein M3Y97_00319200 [Aphelenchoides bicaudatus]|nr:hypothetical protein M3Y97_00319200 [Aphelenchoides bicaudatus]
MHRSSVLVLALLCAFESGLSLNEFKYELDDSSFDTFKPPARCFQAQLTDGFETPVSRWFFQYKTCHEYEYNGGEQIADDQNLFKTKAECLVTCAGDPCLKKSALDDSWTGGAYKQNGQIQTCSYNNTDRTDNCPNWTLLLNGYVNNETVINLKSDSTTLHLFCSLDGSNVERIKGGVCCREETHDICSLPKNEGRISLNFNDPRAYYFYNSKTDACEQFLYKGLEGNQNRFSTIDYCTKACVKGVCQNDLPYSKQLGPIVCDVNNEGSCPTDFRCVLDKNKMPRCCRPAPEPSTTAESHVSLAVGKSIAVLFVVFFAFL